MFVMPTILKYRRLELLKEIYIEAELCDFVKWAIWRHPNIEFVKSKGPGPFAM